jgi:hypothetical protein
MGEYHRIKRLIDENTLELTDKTKWYYKTINY